MHSAFCGRRDGWHTLLVEGAIIATKRWGGGHRSEIYSVFTFFLIHCPANTAITAAACHGCKSVPAMRNVLLVVKQRQESRRVTYGGKHSISAAAHPQPDSRTYFSVWSFSPLKEQFTQNFNFAHRLCCLPATGRCWIHTTVLEFHNQREFWLMDVCCGRGIQPNQTTEERKTLQSSLVQNVNVALKQPHQSWALVPKILQDYLVLKKTKLFSHVFLSVDNSQKYCLIVLNWIQYQLF